MILSLKQLFSESVEKSSLMKNTGPTHASVNDAEQLHLVQRETRNYSLFQRPKHDGHFWKGHGVPQTVPLCSWESNDCHEPKKCWGADKGSSKGSAQFSVQPWYQLLYSCMCFSGGFMNVPGWHFCCSTKTSPVHNIIYSWQGLVHCIQVQNTIRGIHTASSEFITQQPLQQIITISSQERNLWTILAL